LFAKGVLYPVESNAQRIRNGSAGISWDRVRVSPACRFPPNAEGASGPSHIPTSPAPHGGTIYKLLRLTSRFFSPSFQAGIVPIQNSRHNNTTMEDRFLPANISIQAFNALLDQYASTVPSKLEQSENSRLRVIPQALEQRKKSGKAFLTRDEVIALLEWKL